MTGPLALITANTLIDVALMLMLIALMVGVAATRNMLTSILLMVFFSLVMATWFVVMDAADVAFTEAVVGAGISTVVLLGAILLTRSQAKEIHWRRIILPAILCAIAGGVFVYAGMDLPALGDAASPANTHVGRYYIENTYREIGVPNMVTAVLSSYRGFDTLGETTVIFAASLGVAIMLGFGERAMSPLERNQPAMKAMAESDYHVVLRVAAKLLIPLIALFAFYVQFHGDLGPGGGFQAGVILAAAIILHALVFGLRETMRAIRPGFARGVAALGVLVYSGVGVASMINGGAFLDYDHLFTPEGAALAERLFGGDGHHNWGQHFGILGIELGVLLTVAATMVTVFYGFAGRAPDAPASRKAPEAGLEAGEGA